MTRRGTRKGAEDATAVAGPRLKVVVRKLPPNLPEQVFWESVSPWIARDGDQQRQAGSETAAWTCYRPGKLRQAGNKDKSSVNSRAYITFKTPEALVTFHKAYDGWSFRDKLGRVSQAVVEFAPYQKTPPKSTKKDTKQGTIEDDEDYRAFVKALDEPEQAAQADDSAQVKIEAITPLIEHLRKKRAANKTGKPAKQGKGKGKEAATATASTSQAAADGAVEKSKGTKLNRKERRKKKEAAAAAAAATDGTSTATAGESTATQTGETSEEKKRKRQRHKKGKEKAKADNATVDNSGNAVIAPNVTPLILKNPDRPPVPAAAPAPASATTASTTSKRELKVNLPGSQSSPALGAQPVPSHPSDVKVERPAGAAGRGRGRGGPAGSGRGRGMGKPAQRTQSEPSLGAQDAAPSEAGSTTTERGRGSRARGGGRGRGERGGRGRGASRGTGQDVAAPT